MAYTRQTRLQEMKDEATKLYGREEIREPQLAALVRALQLELKYARDEEVRIRSMAKAGGYGVIRPHIRAAGENYDRALKRLNDAEEALANIRGEQNVTLTPPDDTKEEEIYKLPRGPHSDHDDYIMPRPKYKGSAPYRRSQRASSRRD